VSAARPLIANNDLVEIFRSGQDRPKFPCTYCNKCLVNVVENPLGCYEESRFPSREAMMEQIMSVFRPESFTAEPARV
jgi:2,4-dienoyl-CoA reductase (NADPH2)